MRKCDYATCCCILNCKQLKFCAETFFIRLQLLCWKFPVVSTSRFRSPGDAQRRSSCVRAGRIMPEQRSSLVPPECQDHAPPDKYNSLIKRPGWHKGAATPFMNSECAERPNPVDKGDGPLFDLGRGLCSERFNTCSSRTLLLMTPRRILALTSRSNGFVCSWTGKLGSKRRQTGDVLCLKLSLYCLATAVLKQINSWPNWWRLVRKCA